MLAYRRAATRIRETGGSVAQLALDGQGEGAPGDRQDDRGEDRRSRRGRRDARAHEAQGAGARRGRRVHAPARARPEDGARGSGQELGDHDARRAEGGGRGGAAARRSPASGAKSEEKILKALAEEPSDRGRAAARCSATALPAVLDASSRSCARIPPRSQVSEAGSVAAPPRDRPRPRHHRDRERSAPALIDGVLASADWVAEVVAQRRHEGDGRHARRPSLRPPRRPARVLRQPAPALHGLEGPQRRAARGRACGAGSRSPSTGSPTSRPGEVVTHRDEEELYEFLGYALHPAGAARERRRARGGARTASCPSSSSSATCAATCTATRPGRRTARTRSRRWRARRTSAATSTSRITDHSHYLRDGRLEAQWRGDRRAQRAAGAVPDPARDRGEHPRGRLARRRRRGARRARLGRRVAAHVASTRRPDRADPRRDGEPARRLHRAPDRPEDRQARPARRSTSSGWSRRALETGTVARDQLPARPARPARRPRAARRRGGRADPDHDATRTRSARSATSSSAIGAGAARLADEGAGPEHALLARRSRSSRK